MRVKATAALFAAILTASALSARAQDDAGAQAGLPVVSETLVALDGTQSTGSMLRRLSTRDVFASAVITGDKTSNIDFGGVQFGSFPKHEGATDGTWFLCTLIRSLDARYSAFVPIEVKKPHRGIHERRMSRKGLNDEEKEFVDTAYNSDNILVRSFLALDCDDTSSEILVATGFTKDPKYIDIKIALNQIVPLTLTATREDNPSQVKEVDCRPNGNPVGYRCRIELTGDDPFDPGLYEMKAVIRSGNDEVTRKTLLDIPDMSIADPNG